MFNERMILNDHYIRAILSPAEDEIRAVQRFQCWSQLVCRNRLSVVSLTQNYNYHDSTFLGSRSWSIECHRIGEVAAMMRSSARTLLMSKFAQGQDLDWHQKMLEVRGIMLMFSRVSDCNQHHPATDTVDQQVKVAALRHKQYEISPPPKI